MGREDLVQLRRRHRCLGPLDQGLAIDSAGKLYGTTFVGGAYGYGAVYELVAGAGGTWTEKVLYSFKGLNEGAAPFASPLVLDSAGNLYGAAWQGGARTITVSFISCRVVQAGSGPRRYSVRFPAVQVVNLRLAVSRSIRQAISTGRPCRWLSNLSMVLQGRGPERSCIGSQEGQTEPILSQE